MKQYNAAHFRRNMSKTFDQCEGSNQPVLITTRKDNRDEPQQMIIISKAQYDLMNKLNEGEFAQQVKLSHSEFNKSVVINKIKGVK